MAAAKKTGPAAGGAGKRSGKPQTKRNNHAAVERTRTNKASPQKGQQLELKEQPSVWRTVRTLLGRTFFGRVFLILLAFFLLAGLDILLAGNEFDRFALILGLEAIGIGLIVWLLYLVRNRDDFF